MSIIPPTPFRFGKTQGSGVVVATNHTIFFTNIYYDAPVVQHLYYPNIKNMMSVFMYWMTRDISGPCGLGDWKKMYRVTEKVDQLYNNGFTCRNGIFQLIQYIEKIFIPRRIPVK